MDKVVKQQNILNILMAEIGNFSPYQRYQYALQVISALITGLHMHSLITVAAIPEHRCEIPNVDINGTMADLNFTTLTNYIPLRSGNQIDTCHIYNVTSKVPIKCNNWVYNRTYYTSSRAIEWNTICEKKWMTALCQTIFVFGVLWGDIILGYVADKVGRKPVFCWTILLSVALGIGVSFISNYYFFLVVRFFLGVTSCAGAHTAGFVMTMELIGPNERSLAGMGYQISFAIGIMLVAFWGWIIKNRQLLQIIYALHGLPLLIHWRLLDESPRWLWATGRYKESLEIIQKALHFNGSKTTLDLDNLLPKKLDKKSKLPENVPRLWILFKKPNLRKRILNVGLCWFANFLLFYGLSLRTGSMKGNPFLLLFLMGVIEIPGLIFVMIVLDKLGRRFLTCFTMIISGLCCSLAASVITLSAISTMLIYLGRLSMSASIDLLFIYTSELFPTISRNSALGFALMCARVSSSLAPFVNLLDSFDPKLSCILFGVITILSGCLVMFLPETLGICIPSSIDEAEKFGIGDNCCSSFYRKNNIAFNRAECSTEVSMEQTQPLNVL